MPEPALTSAITGVQNNLAVLLLWISAVQAINHRNCLCSHLSLLATIDNVTICFENHHPPPPIIQGPLPRQPPFHSEEPLDRHIWWKMSGCRDHKLMAEVVHHSICAQNLDRKVWSMKSYPQKRVRASRPAPLPKSSCCLGDRCGVGLDPEETSPKMLIIELDPTRH